MLRKFAYMPLLALLLFPAAGHALGLGELTVNSALNEPLDAEIALTGVRPSELDALQVRLAPPESFSRVGLDRPFVLTQLRFSAERGSDGQPVIKVTTREALREPFLTFLIETSWSRGRLLREYTVMVDPPVMMPAVTAPVRAAEPARPTTPRAAPTEVVETVETVADRTPMLGRIPDDRMQPATGEYGPIQRDDTLWSIAERAKPSADITTSQMMLALYEANPDAFYGNINRMKTGYVLRVPDRETITRRSPADAYREATRHNEAWRTGEAVTGRVADAGPAAADDRLRLSAPGARDPVATADVDSVPGAVVDPELERELADTRGELSEERDARRALATRLAELERETQELRRLLEIRDAELEALTGRAPDRPETAAPVDAIEPVETTEPEPVADPADAVAEPVETAPEAAPAEPEAPRDPRRVGPPPADDPGLMGLLTNPLVIALLLGIPIVLALALVALRRRRASADANRVLTPGDDESDDDATALRETATDEVDPEQTQLGGGAAAVAAAAAADDAEAGDADDSAQPAAEDDLTASAVMKLDEGDPASEADFHLAYGLYDQAAELMEGAYAQQPDRVDYLMKLLEIYFAWGKTDEFVQHAKEGRSKLEAAGEWGNVAILGRQMNADDALFSDMGATGTRDGVDLDLETGAGDDDGGVDLDTGEFESALDLGEPDAGDEGAPADEAPADEAPADDADAGLEFDLGDFEYPGEEEAAADAETPADETQAIDLDASPDETQAIDLDLDVAEDADAGAEASTDEGVDESADEGSIDFDESALELPDEPADDAAGETTQFKVDQPVADDDGLDLDLDSALAGLETEEDSSGIESSFSDESKADDADADASDDGDELSLDFDALLEADADADSGDAPESSDSRLDLARAYIDMGDADGARSLLNEVLADGDDTQKREAEELLALIS